MHVNRAGRSGMMTAASASGSEVAFLLHLPEQKDQSEMSHLAPPPEE